MEHQQQHGLQHVRQPAPHHPRVNQVVQDRLVKQLDYHHKLVNQVLLLSNPGQVLTVHPDTVRGQETPAMAGVHQVASVEVVPEEEAAADDKQNNII